VGSSDRAIVIGNNITAETAAHNGEYVASNVAAVEAIQVAQLPAFPVEQPGQHHQADQAGQGRCPRPPGG